MRTGGTPPIICRKLELTNRSGERQSDRRSVYFAPLLACGSDLPLGWIALQSVGGWVKAGAVTAGTSHLS
ncbi:hypothetical protein [Altericista sp. CCNU0014]|uniref:hypothetical protein n=1 Tax=Altericista sp. CCNU0014 TaxID=3082949 RepID=UPI00384DDFD6